MNTMQPREQTLTIERDGERVIVTLTALSDGGADLVEDVVEKIEEVDADVSG